MQELVPAQHVEDDMPDDAPELKWYKIYPDLQIAHFFADQWFRKSGNSKKEIFTMNCRIEKHPEFEGYHRIVEDL